MPTEERTDKYHNVNNKKSLVQILVSSTIGGWGYGFLAAVLSHPLDTIKTRQQILTISNNNFFASLSENINDTARSRRLWTSLYDGVAPAVSASVLFRAVPFTTYEAVVAYLSEDTNICSWDWNEHKIARAACGGAAGGLARASLEFPFEAYKVKAQAGATVSNVKDIWSGFAITVIRNMGVIALFWAFMESSKETREYLAPVAKYPRGNAFIAGGGCSVAAWSLVYPFDVIKSHVQIRHYSPSGHKQHEFQTSCKSSKSSFRQNAVTIRHVIQQGFCAQEGPVNFFYRGFSAGMFFINSSNSAVYALTNYLDMYVFYFHRGNVEYF